MKLSSDYYPQFIKLWVLFILFYSNIFSQEVNNKSSLDSSESSINWNRTALIGCSIVAVNTGLWFLYNDVYYSNQKKVKMHSRSDWFNYTLNIDKLGHIHSTLTLHKLSTQASRWCNFSEENSLWIGSAISWFHMLQIELSDSRYEKWGFSWEDFSSNTIGALYPNLQYYFPLMKSFNLKFSYHPSGHFKQKYVDQFIEDYEGKTYWLTINIHDLLPSSLKPYWFDWLQIAIGYGGEKLIVPHTKSPWWKYNSVGKKGLGEQEWYISFDYDLIGLFKPENNSFWYTLLENLNLLHFPSPAIRISPSSIYYGIYF